MNKFPAASKPLAQPSTRSFRVFEAAGIVEESSQRSSDLSWFDHVRFPANRLSQSLRRNSMRGNRYPRLCPQSPKVKRCLIRLTRGRNSKSTPEYTTSWAPNHRIPDLSRCQSEMLRCWRRPCEVLQSPTISSGGQCWPCSVFLATQARFPWMTPCWINSNDRSHRERGM